MTRKSCAVGMRNAILRNYLKLDRKTVRKKPFHECLESYAFFEKYGGLNFLLKCNYNTKKSYKSVPLFYLEMLDYFQELRQVNQNSYESDLILWNNQNITIEFKSLYWKRWTENEIYYIQDILNENGKFLSFEECNRKYNMSANFLNFFQILASIPPSLKSKAASTLRPKNSVLDSSDIFLLLP